MLGTIHTVLSGITAPPGTRCAPAADHIDAADVSQTTRRACSAIRSWASSVDEERIASLSEELANGLLYAGEEATKEFPRHLLRGDFWDNNVKFRDGSVWRCWTSTLWRRGLASTTSRWFSTTPTPDRP
jgi:hypothetical protein